MSGYHPSNQSHDNMDMQAKQQMLRTWCNLGFSVVTWFLCD